jgi:hypothetical protein
MNLLINAVRIYRDQIYVFGPSGAVSSKGYKLRWMSCIYFYFYLYVCCLETYFIG